MLMCGYMQILTCTYHGVEIVQPCVRSGLVVWVEGIGDQHASSGSSVIGISQDGDS
jgi:hypothetical protein